MLSFRCFLLSSVIALAPTAAYAYTYTICMKHLVHVVDSGLGEDYEVSSSGYSAWVSRGTKVRVLKGGVWSAYDKTNTTTGCFTYSSGAGGAADIELTAQHTLANNQNLYIRNNYGTPVTKVWTFATTLPASNATLTFYTPYGNESNLSAIAPWVVHRITSLTGNLPQAANKYLYVFNENCSAYSGSCDGSAFAYGVQSLFIAPEYNHSERKFLVGHEVAHWIERWWGNNVGGVGGYGYNDNDPDCEFTGLGDHSMFSLEVDFPAYIEGIAHFISAVAWNDPSQGSGVFKFYKVDGWYDNDTVLLDTPGDFSFDWEGSECAPKEEGKSVEGDWLRHFWNYLNDPTGLDFNPSMVDIAEMIAQMYDTGTFTSTTAYASLTEALDDAGYGIFTSHWENHAENHGVVDP